jgi:hypothetical protein
MITLRAHLRRAARKRWEKASEEERKQNAARASRAYWDRLTPEMKRRAKKRKKKPRAK